MKIKIIITLFLCFVLVTFYGQIIHVPADQPTIQAGIDIANEGDTVLVQPGTYIENIYINKNITLTSLFLTTGDTSYISQTIIDGDQNNSVVKFGSGVNSAAILTGFTITNGRGGSFQQSHWGGGISSYGSPTLKQLIITNNTAPYGGGIYCTDNSNLTLQNMKIAINQGELGGGIYCADNSHLSLQNVTITNNQAEWGGGVYCTDSSTLVFDDSNRCNIYFNNGEYGGDLYSDDFIEVVVDTFSVMFPTQYYVEPLENFLFDVNNGKIQQADTDLFVSSDGDNSNSGLSEEEPLKNIDYASSVIRADSLHHNTIHLMEGIYSPSSNDEIFPVRIYNYCNLEGTSEDSVILDAEEQSGVMILFNNTSAIVSNMTLKNGLTNNPLNGSWGGVYGYKSSAILQNMRIEDNKASGSPFGPGHGGGVSMNESSLTLINVIISNNKALGGIISGGSGTGGSGGGIYCRNNSNPVLQNVSITNNSAKYGGGISCQSNSQLYMQNVLITGNHGGFGGGINCSDSSSILFDDNNRSNIYLNDAAYGDDIFLSGNMDMEVIVDTFSVLLPHDYHASPIGQFSFDIMNGKVEQIDSDVYVSPDGDNENSGLTVEEPLKNISQAIYKIVSDSMDAHTVHLMEGTYSLSTCGETFPVYMISYFNLRGDAADAVILDGEESGENIIEMHKQNSLTISDLTVTGASGGYGSRGIYCFESNPILQNLIISENIGYVPGAGGYGGGGGMYFGSSTATLKNLLITNNLASRGGGISCYHSDLELQNVTLSDNKALSSVSGSRGGGIYCSDSSNITLLNTIMWNDTAQEIWFYENGVSNEISIGWSDIQGGMDGIVTNGNGTVNWLDGNIDEDPLFLGSSNHPYQINDNSPCIDAGTPDTTGLNLPPWDILGNQRIWDGDGNGTAVIDMGAYEYGSIPVGYFEQKLQNSELKIWNFPNPFSTSTTIAYNLHHSTFVQITIYNHLGKQIEMIEKDQPQGLQKVVWNPRNLPNGVYYIRLQAGEQVALGKIVLMR